MNLAMPDEAGEDSEEADAAADADAGADAASEADASLLVRDDDPDHPADKPSRD